MIVHNDFGEYKKTAEEIDRELVYVNLSIHRIPKGETPHCMKSKVYIDDRGDEGYYGSELCHEGRHLCTDPITYQNNVDGIIAIKEKLGVDEVLVDEQGRPVLKAQVLANIASDMVVDHRISQSKIEKGYRAKGIPFFVENIKEKPNPLSKEIIALKGKFAGVKVGWKPKLFKKVVKIIENTLDRKERYVELSRLFLPLFNKSLEETEGEGKPVFGRNPLEKGLMKLAITPSEGEEKQAVQQAISQSQNAEEAKKKLQIMKAVGNESASHALRNDTELLVRFYESQARKVILSIDFPKEPTIKGIKLGAQKWKPTDGLRAIDAKKTIIKYGVNIPMVTTQKGRVLPKFISEKRDLKPIALVISLDVSGSTGQPEGSMSETSDYEVVMFYALANLARKVEQLVGYTLWETRIVETTLPKMYDWREVEKLKKKILGVEWGGGTEIDVALRQARQYPNKLFFVFTDGYVDEIDLIDCDNVQFFLVQTDDLHEGWFTEKYGRERVVRIDNLEKLPRIALARWKRLFWT